MSYSHPGDRDAATALTAALLATDGRLGRPRPASAPAALARIETAVCAGRDALLAWNGTQALANYRRSLDAPVKALLASQRADGAWTASSDAHCASGGDAVTTAFGVLALAQAYAR